MNDDSGSAPSVVRHLGDLTPGDWRNVRRLLAALVAWAVPFTLLSQLAKRGVLTGGPLGWALAVLPVAGAALVVAAYARYLAEADELHRWIHLLALATGFAGAFFAGATYPLFVRLGAPPLGATELIAAMTVFYAVGCAVGVWRYR